MTTQSGTKEALSLWQHVSTECVRQRQYDLSMRQLSLLLSVYLDEPPHTVKGLSAKMKVSKPAICRALDTLSHNGLLKRTRDDKDRRNVFIQRTVKGSVFLTEFSEIVMKNLANI